MAGSGALFTKRVFTERVLTERVFTPRDFTPRDFTERVFTPRVFTKRFQSIINHHRCSRFTLSLRGTLRAKMARISLSQLLPGRSQGTEAPRKLLALGRWSKSDEGQVDV